MKVKNILSFIIAIFIISAGIIVLLFFNQKNETALVTEKNNLVILNPKFKCQITNQSY